MNEFLQWKQIVEKQLFIIIDVSGYHSRYDSGRILSFFKQLCQNILKLFMQQIAIDIKISFEEVKDKTIFDLYSSIYLSYFNNKEFFAKYNKPKCNSHLCLPRVKPYTYFYVNEKDESFMLSATNVFL